MKRILILNFLMYIFLAPYSQCTQNLLNNGDFTSPEGMDVAAPGWGKISTTDVNDENDSLNTSPGYNWTGTPLASPNGGTWQNIYFLEAVYQDVNVIAQQIYYLKLEICAQGISNPFNTFNGPVGINIYVDTSLVYASSEDSTLFSWEIIQCSFTAPDSIIRIQFETTANQYIAVDGACLSTSPILDLSSTISPSANVLYPNPFDKNIQVSNNFEGTVILINSLGQTVLHQNISAGEFIKTNSLSSGMYNYLLTSKEGMSKVSGRLLKH